MAFHGRVSPFERLWRMKVGNTVERNGERPVVSGIIVKSTMKCWMGTAACAMPSAGHFRSPFLFLTTVSDISSCSLVNNMFFGDRK